MKAINITSFEFQEGFKCGQYDVLQFLLKIQGVLKHNNIVSTMLENKIEELKITVEKGIKPIEEKPKGCGKKEYIKTEKGGTWAICGCNNGWYCNKCKEEAER